jgi:excisionase family DNA binding protein
VVSGNQRWRDLATSADLNPAGGDWLQLIDPVESRRLIALLTDAARAGGSVTIEVQGRAGQWFEMYSAPAGDIHGDGGLVLMIVDVSARKHREELLAFEAAHNALQGPQDSADGDEMSVVLSRLVRIACDTVDARYALLGLKGPDGEQAALVQVDGEPGTPAEGDTIDLRGGADDNHDWTDYMRPADAARTLHVGVRTIRRWADDGLVPCIHTLGGHRRFSRDAIASLARQFDTDGPVTSPSGRTSRPADH